MPPPFRTIRLRAQAPAKPPVGQACNGCGLCCMAEPCPLGVLLSRRRQGRCRALLWNADTGQYRCGALTQPQRFLPWLPSTWATAWVRRWIAASAGCDATLEPQTTLNPPGASGA